MMQLERSNSEAPRPGILPIPAEAILPLPLEYDAIIISDIHLGSRMCQARELDLFLSLIRVKYLILAGDIFDDLKFNRLQHWHWQVLSRIRKISDHCQVVWLRGNHDTVSARTLSHLLGVEVRNYFLWESCGKIFYAVHGDRWDTVIYKHKRLTAFYTFVYDVMQALNSGRTRNITQWLKKTLPVLRRNSEAVKSGAVRFAQSRGYDAIFCGHTHMAMLEEVDGTLYGNDGTWQSDVPHFIGIRGLAVHLAEFRGTATLVKSQSL